MRVEIRGVGFRNKGSELMLHAVVEEAARWAPRADLAVSAFAGDYGQRARLGLHQKLWVARLGVFADLPPRVLPGIYRRWLGVVLDSEINAVLDASGFAYSDQWGAASSRFLARWSRNWKRQGKKVILLPQAFGPFERPEVRAAFAQSLDYVDLLFARDEVSYGYLMGLGKYSEKIRQAPDFTIGVRGALPPGWKLDGRLVAIVPNSRMLDKTRDFGRDEYLALLARVMVRAREAGCRPVILVHDEGDGELARGLQEMVTVPVPVVHEPDPVFLKGIIGSCYALVGSRYHALVSALSQGVPALATAWSHKYQLLFDEFDCPTSIVETTRWRAEIDAKVEALLYEPTHSLTMQQLVEPMTRYQLRTDEMWRVVREVLGVTVGSDSNE